MHVTAADLQRGLRFDLAEHLPLFSPPLVSNISHDLHEHRDKIPDTYQIVVNDG